MKGPLLLTAGSLTCIDCEYHYDGILKSGRSPVYTHYCKHKEFKDYRDLPGGGGRQIVVDGTPTWCPFLNFKERVQTLPPCPFCGQPALQEGHIVRCSSEMCQMHYVLLLDEDTWRKRPFESR